MLILSRKMCFHFSHTVARFSVLLLFLLSLPFVVQAQGCPELQTSDFSIVSAAGNTDCHTPGALIVTYRNNVVGFEKLMFEVSKDNVTFAHPVETTQLSAPTTVPLPGWNAGDHIYLRVTAYCSGTSKQLVLTVPDYATAASSAVSTHMETTPAGGCNATSGSLSVSLDGVTGFSKVEYRLYTGSSLIASETSTTPYLPTTFYNLLSGDHTLVVRATPSCTPATPGADWKNGAYEISRTVKIGFFSVLPSPILSRGTCDGGVTIRTARVVGISKIKYEIFTSGGATSGSSPIQQKETDYPSFTHTFLSLPPGLYEVKATADCGVSEIVPFEVKIGSAGTLTATALQNTYAHCSIGKIIGRVPGTTVACPVDYTLIPSGGAPPIVKSGITTEEVVFDGLPKGTYTLKAVWAGQTQTTTAAIVHTTLGTMNLTAVKAERVCDPSGSITMKLENGDYLESGILEFWVEGNMIRSVSLSAGQNEKTVNGLSPGDYTVKYRSACGAEISGQVNISFKQLIYQKLSSNSGGWGGTTVRLQYCNSQNKPTYEFAFAGQRFTDMDAGTRAFYEGSTYEVYNEAGDLVGSGPIVYSDNFYWLQSKEPGNLTVKIRSACGSPVQTFKTVPIYDAAVVGIPTPYGAIPCTGGNGKVYVSYSSNYGQTLKLSIKKSSDQSIVAEHDVPATETGNSYTFENIPYGEYIYEWYPVCNPLQKHTTPFVQHAVMLSSKSIYAGTNNPATTEGRIYAYFQQYYFSGGTLKFKYTLTNDDTGTEVAHGEGASVDVQKLVAGNYTIRFKTTGGPCTIPDDVFHFTVPLTTTTSLPNNSFPQYVTVTTKKAAHVCKSDGEIEVSWANAPAGTTGPMTWDVLDPKTHAVLASKTEADPKTVVKFQNLPIGYFFLRGTNPQGTYYQSIGVQADMNSILSLFKVSYSSEVIGCSMGSIRVQAPLKAAGFTDMPVKIMLTRQNYPSYGSTVVWDSVKSTTLIEDYTFNNLEAGEYNLTYSLCGTDIPFGYGVVGQVNGEPTVTVWAKNSLPCQKAEVQVTMGNVDGDAKVKLTVVDRQTGVTVMTKNFLGRDMEILELSPGDYDFNAEIDGKCVTGTATQNYKVPEQSFYVNVNYRMNIEGCPNSGYFTMNVPTPGRLTKVSYSYTKQGTGEVDSGDVTGDVTKPFTFANLTKGKYDLKAVGSCQFADGTYKEYEWKSTYELNSYYTPFQAIPYPNGTYASMPCPTGAIGLQLSGGWDSRYKVYITHGPSGAVVPEQEIKPLDNTGNRSWGGNLPAGTYNIHATDSCKDIYLTGLVVPSIADEVNGAEFYSSYNQMYILDDCSGYRFRYIKYKTNTKYTDYSVVSKLPFYYEIAAVPRGIAPVESDWSPLYKQYSTTYEYIMPSWTQDYFMYSEREFQFKPMFDYTKGVDFYVRVKGCPATTRYYTGVPVLGTNFSWDYNLPVCTDYRFKLRTVDVCRPVDIILTRQSDNHEMLRQNNVTFTGKLTQDHYYPETPLPNGDYKIEIKDHATGTVISQTSHTAFNGTVTFYYASLMSVACNTARYSFSVRSDCPIQGKFVLYNASNVKVAESTYGQNSYWNCPLDLVKGQTYYLEFVDNAGHNQLASREALTVDYVIPNGYKIADLKLGDKCNSKYEYGYLYRDNFIITWPAGKAYNKYGVPKISRMEVKNTATGDIWYSTGEFEVSSNAEGFNNIGRWKHRLPNGTEKADVANDLPFGNYTYTVKDECGTYTSNFTISYKAPAEVDLSSSTITMDCQGKFTITPKGRAYFPDRPDPITITSCSYNGQTINWGGSFDTYDTRVNNMYVNLKFQDGTSCYGYWSYDLSRYTLQLDESQISSFFCANTGKGQVTMALKGGRPPYTYTLKKPDGTIVATKSGLPGAVLFEEGLQGEKYIVDATDACGNSFLHQNVTIQDPIQLGYSMDRTYDFCEGETAKFSALNLGGATYTWEHPNGTITHDKDVTITTSTATAGEYKVHVKPQTCTTTIDAKIKVNVARVKESWKKETKRVCSGQSVVFNIGKPTVLLNGTPSTTQKYQWQINSDTLKTYDWKAIAGATAEDLTYTPPYSGTFYLRRITTQGSCSSYSYASTLIVDPGLTSTISPDELSLVIDHKDPFTITAGFLSGNPSRTYQWQRSIDKVSWTNIGTGVTYTETQQYAPRVYYRRITTAGTCSTESPIITVRFKKRYPALVNPQLRQRVKQD